MAASAFIIGFFTAFGWWTAGKITDQIDEKIDQPTTIEQKEENVKESR